MADQLGYALVTGASSGIGWHISKELAALGYAILAVSNQADQLELLRTEIESFGVKYDHLECDLSTLEAANSVFDYCVQKEIEVEVLVNNAGILVYGETISVEPKLAQTILQLHMNTPAMLGRLFGEPMAKRKHGYILNVSSISAVMPYPTISLYGPTKTFLRKFSRALRTEMLGHGVSVTCLLPGATATALYDANKVDIPLAMKLGVMKKPEDVAKSGVNALFHNRAESIPGILNRLIMVLVRFVPHSFIGWVHRKMNS